MCGYFNEVKRMKARKIFCGGRNNSHGRLMSSVLPCLVWLCLQGCVSVPSPWQRGEQARQLAANAGWNSASIDTGEFTLRAYLPGQIKPAETLSVYLEGDGLAWIGSSTPADDPTPVNPLALKLALRDGQAAAYLARPCQYLAAEQLQICREKYWTSHRFAPEAIRAANAALDELKRRFSASRLILIGYSGGGAVAALAAAERQDVSRLITVAGNLDHRFWTGAQHLSPLSGSLNPADVWRQLQNLPQTHLVGAEDDIVGEAVAHSYAAHFQPPLDSSIVLVPKFNHVCCWEAHWPQLKLQAMQD